MTRETPRVYLDSNVFIAAFESPGATSDHAWWVMEAIERGEILATTSELTLAEILVKPLEMGDTRLSEGYEKILTSSSEFSVLPVQRDILIDAARLRSGLSSLRLPDAIHVATARASRCSVFVSNDRRLRRIGDVRMVALSPFTVDDILGHAS